MKTTNKVYSVSDNKFAALVKRSHTVADVLRSVVGVDKQNLGCYYPYFWKRVKELELSVHHFDRFKNHRSGMKRRNLEEILVKGSLYRQTGNLKKRLLKTGLLKGLCEKCGQGPQWHGELLVLQLDHKNGDPTDNRLANLRLLCPNCHSQTPTFTGRNKKRGPMKNYDGKIVVNKQKIKHYCADCGVEISFMGKRCKSCSKKNLYQINWPSPNKVVKRLGEVSYAQVARELGVVDGAVRKFLRRNGITPPR